MKVYAEASNPFMAVVLIETRCIHYANRKRLVDAYLSEEEKCFADKIRRGDDFLAGRIAAKMAYSRYCGGRAYNDITIFHDLWDAPYLDDAHCFLTLSHCEFFVGAIACDTTRLKAGLDIVDAQAFSREESTVFLNDGELRLLGEQNVVSVWAAKEALSKYLQMGCQIFDCLRVAQWCSADERMFVFAGLEHIPVLVREANGHFFAFACDENHLHLFSTKYLTLPPISSHRGGICTVRSY